MKYMSVHAASAKWRISERRVQKLCKENRIAGAQKFCHIWVLPAGTEKPFDARRKNIKRGDFRD